MKFVAAFLAPIVLSLFFVIYNLVHFIFIYNDLPSFSLDGFLFVYIYALPVYLLFGVPVSIIIEKINKGIRWLNYSLAGVVGGLIIVLINSTEINSTQDYMTALAYSVAGFSYYCTLRVLELIESNLQN